MPAAQASAKRGRISLAIKGKISARCAQNRTEQVAKDFDRNRDNAQFEAAASCWQRGDVEGSKTMLEHLLERNPNYPRARFVLADIYLFNGDSSRAIEELQKVVDSNPGNAVAHHALAQVLDASGQRNEALSHYKQAATLEPKNEIYALSYNTAMASTKPGAVGAATAAQSPQAPQANFAAAKVGGGVNITEQPDATDIRKEHVGGDESETGTIADRFQRFESAAATGAVCIDGRLGAAA